ncbi:MAG: glycosyltransferase family 4 protein [Pseudomonadota bacterium]
MAGSKPHIILVGGDGHPSGVPRHITDLARILQDMARITVISEPDQGGFGELERLGIRHISVPGLSSSMHPLQLRQGWRTLKILLASEPADIVWLHARLPVILGRHALANGVWQPPDSTRIAVTYHGLPFGQGHKPWAAKASQWLEKRLLSRCPSLDLVFLTEAHADSMARMIGPAMAKHGTHVLGNTSHLGPLPEDVGRPEGRHIVMTARCGWQKNYESALRLFRALPKDVTLSLSGRGTDSPRFRAHAMRLAGDAAPRLRCLGSLPDVRHLLACADGYMLTSRYEGQPIGVLEACEAGLPIILSGFEGSDALLQDHPMGLRLTQSDVDRDAAGVDALLTRYLSDRAEYEKDIRAHWTNRWSPAMFKNDVRSLVAKWLLQAPHPENRVRAMSSHPGSA